MVDVRKIKKSICEISKLIYIKNLSDSAGGNISVRDGNKIFITPRGLGSEYQWNIEEDLIIVTDLCKTPIIGQVENISREVYSHFKIYQNFPDINAIIHAHPFYFMAFGAANMDLPAMSEPSAEIIGNLPVINIEQSIPGSEDQARKIVENFKNRRKADPEAKLLCGVPFHGAFAAATDINKAFLFMETLNNCAKVIAYRQILFGNNPKAKFGTSKVYTKDEIATINNFKEVCDNGYQYKDVYGDLKIYNAKNKNKVDNKGD
jgi:L-fuculose-phosphate aldolase